jgi:hypothetical protein
MNALMEICPRIPPIRAVPAGRFRCAAQKDMIVLGLADDN